MNIISNEKREADLADAIVSRTHEVYGYDVNIANYEAILAVLPSEWPEDLENLRTLHPHDAATQCPPGDIDLLADLQHRDQISALIQSERLERSKAQRLLDAMDAQLTGPGRDAAIQAAIERREAALSGAGA